MGWTDSSSPPNAEQAERHRAGLIALPTAARVVARDPVQPSVRIAVGDLGEHGAADLPAHVVEVGLDVSRGPGRASEVRGRGHDVRPAPRTTTSTVSQTCCAPAIWINPRYVPDGSSPSFSIDTPIPRLDRAGKLSTDWGSYATVAARISPSADRNWPVWNWSGPIAVAVPLCNHSSRPPLITLPESSTSSSRAVGLRVGAEIDLDARAFIPVRVERLPERFRGALEQRNPGLDEGGGVAAGRRVVVATSSRGRRAGRCRCPVDSTRNPLDEVARGAQGLGLYLCDGARVGDRIEQRRPRGAAAVTRSSAHESPNPFGTVVGKIVFATFWPLEVGYARAGTERTAGAMSEQEDLFVIYGAIDRAVRDDPTRRQYVAGLLPGYASDDPKENAIGWFDEFERWTVELVEGHRSPFLDFAGAVSRLAETPTSGRLAARRIHAVWAALRVGLTLPGEAEGDIARALAVDGIAAEDGDQGVSAREFRAKEFVSWLQNDEKYKTLEQWPELIVNAIDVRLISRSLAVHAAAKPCSGTLVKVKTPGDDHPAAELETTFTTTQVTLECAERFLEPSNWPRCGPRSYWCAMDPIEPSVAGNPRYHEVFSLDCDNQNQTWTVEANLEFKMIRMKTATGIPTGAHVSYNMSGNQPDNRILVDQGTLTVRRDAAGITVQTVKRIKFNHPFSGESLAAIMCALGYGEAAHRLVLECAAKSATDPHAGTDFPATDPPAPPTVTTKSAAVATSACGATVADVTSESINKAKQYADECVAAYKASYDKMCAGTYTANDAVADAANMWSRYLAGGAAMFDLALRMAGASRSQGTTGTTNPSATTTGA